MENSFMQHPELDGDSFFFESGETAFLLVHGYTATTTEVRTLAEHFLALGHTVAAPLLPGHGTHPDELNQISWQDWYKAVRQTYLDLQSRNKRVWLAGESMGALLCLKLAIDHPKIEGLLLFAPAIKVRYIWIARFLQFFKSHLRKGHGDSTMPWKGYKVYPVKGAVQLLKLQKVVKAGLHKIKQPTLVMVSKADATVMPETGEKLINSISSSQKQLVVLENSPHVMLLGPETEYIFSVAEDFVDTIRQLDEEQLA